MSRLLTRAASGIWAGLSSAARAGAKHGLLKSEQLPARVISVGNIQVGGSGKTPLVARIAREACERSLVCVILCRGYGGEWEREGGFISPSDQDPNPMVCGDEAVLLHGLAPQAFIGVGADRVRIFHHLVKTAGIRPDLVILDDGFQHWKIRKDLEIVAITSYGPSEKLFRDRKKALQHADLLVWTKGDRRPSDLGKPFVRSRYRLVKSPDSRRPLWLVTGVGDPDSVRKLVEEAGCTVAKKFPFPDHAHYDPDTVRNILAKASDAGVRVALTGKDWVKWKAIGVNASEVWVLEPELEFVEGEAIWNQLLWGT